MSEELKNNIEEQDHDHDHECCGHHSHHEHEEHDHDHEHEHCGHHHHHHHDEEGHCCEHEHHHHDEEGHCCGHDHEHEHDHECGCDHDHDHEGHDHGHTYDVPGYKLLETHLHEGATVCSFEKASNMNADEAKAAMEESIIELEHWLEGEGALIGHVKGYIRSGGTTATFSTVGNAAGLHMSEHESAGLSIGFAGIVFGPSEEVLKDKVVEVFERLK